jgi:hypothetical protein
MKFRPVWDPSQAGFFSLECARMLSTWIAQHLTDEDDPELWEIATQVILADALLFAHDAKIPLFAQIGRCDHWIRPHQSRWTAGGGFALPFGYDKTTTGFSFRAKPEFEWSIVLQWTGAAWEPARFQGRGLILRIAIPGRTMQHQQAAIHTMWTPRPPTGAEKRLQLYGFRKLTNGWQFAATTVRDGQPGRTKNEKRKRGGVREMV